MSPLTPILPARPYPACLSSSGEAPVLDLGHSSLKARQRDLRTEVSAALTLRTHRALSWLRRAEQETDDQDARFLFLWIAFNAAYANELPTRASYSERKLFLLFFRKLVALDSENCIYDLIWDNFPNTIRLLIDNRYVFQPYWDYLNGKVTATDWLAQFEHSKAAAHRALGRMNTEKVIAVAFERLYVLRNQLVHGGATWNSRTNRSQVADGVRFLEQVVPLMIRLMLDNPQAHWGEPCYPTVEA